VALVATWLLAGCADAQGLDVALERTVSDADRGVRAVITYRQDVPAGGQEEIINDDGSVSLLHWDAWLGQFTAEITEGSLSGPDAEAFLREAVIAVCPSVDRDQLAREWVQANGPFLRIFAQCPEVDER
jgi:hypothetical protein